MKLHWISTYTILCGHKCPLPQVKAKDNDCGSLRYKWAQFCKKPDNCLPKWLLHPHPTSSEQESLWLHQATGCQCLDFGHPSKSVGYLVILPRPFEALLVDCASSDLSRLEWAPISWAHTYPFCRRLCWALPRALWYLLPWEQCQVGSMGVICMTKLLRRSRSPLQMPNPTEESLCPSSLYGGRIFPKNRAHPTRWLSLNSLLPSPYTRGRDRNGGCLANS